MDKPPVDHALSIIKASLNAVPVIGGPLASLVGDYIPNSTQIHRDAAFAHLEARLLALGSRIDVSMVDKEQFAELFKSTYLIVVRSHHAQRSNAAMNLLANLLLSPDDSQRLPYNEIDHFVRCLDQISIGAIETIGIALRLAKEREGQNGNLSRPISLEALSAAMAEFPRDLIEGLVGELESFNLVRRGSVQNYRIDVDEFPPYELSVTSLGLRFVTYALSEALVPIES